jgi:hypothetical protein
MFRKALEYVFTIWIFKKEKIYMSLYSTPLVDMRFWGHVPNLLRNKNTIHNYFKK